MEVDRMEELLRRLRLPKIREIFQERLQQCARDGTSLADFFGNLLEDEVHAREESQVRSRMKKAGFPFDKTLDEFDFRRHPELRRQVFQSYLDPSFIREGRSLVLIGAPGLGKTHLAVAIGGQQALRGAEVRFVRVQTLVNRVIETSGRERESYLKPFRRCDLLILDEFGYLMPDVETGSILFDLMASRYERASTIITSNKSLKSWGRVLSDNALASALIDRLLHHGEVYALKGESYRLKDKKALEQMEEPLTV